MINLVENNLRTIQKLDSLIANDKMRTQPEPSYIIAMFFLEKFMPQTTTYETLKATAGMGLIGDFELRKRINELYALYESLKTAESVKHGFTNKYVIPFFYEHIDLRSAQAVVSNYWKKPKFKNIVLGSITTLNQLLTQYQACVDKTQELRQELAATWHL